MNFIFRFFIQLITCKSLKWYKPLMKIDIKILPDNVNLVKCSPCQDNLIWWQNNLELGVWWYFVIPVSYFQIIIKYFLAFIFLFVFGISWFWLWSRKQFASPLLASGAALHKPLLSDKSSKLEQTYEKRGRIFYNIEKFY